MFVFERVYAEAEIRDQSEIDAIIRGLASEGHQPALRAMATAASRAATLSGGGLGVESLAIRDPRYRLPGQPDDPPIGDVLFAHSDGIADHCFLLQPFGRRLWAFEIRHHCVPSGLPAFCEAVQHATRAHLDGRRVRGMSFEWQAFKERAARRIANSSRFADAELKTRKPDYSEDELQAARLLVDTEARHLVLTLAQIGKVRAADAKVPTTLTDQLAAASMLKKEYLVLCKKDSHTLCQVSNTEDLNELSGGKLVCATCARKFSEELVHEIFAGTDAGKKLVTGSRWMTIWCTDLLVQAGVSKDSISWSATSGEDEIDMMTEAFGLRVFFELKDREFGLGDAYPFAYRVDRYGGSRGVVISTDKIAEEAEKFFQEQRSKSAASIETIAGSGIEAGIRQLTDKYSRSGVQQVVSDLTGRLGMNISPIVTKWMDTFTSLYRSGRYNAPAEQIQRKAEEARVVGIEPGTATETLAQIVRE